MTDSVPDIRSTLHPRLTVAPGAGRGADLDGVIVGAAELRRAAEVLADERSAERVAVRARLDAAVARAVHDLESATVRRDELQARRQEMLDGADWAVAADAELAALDDAIERARAQFEARRSEQRAARLALDRVLEQRAAAATAMQDAEGQVADLDGVGMDETGLRRELESAGDAARVAHEAHAAAVAAVQRLTDERNEAARRLSQVQDERPATEPAEPRDRAATRRVDAALHAWTLAAAGAAVDNYSQALADAFTDLLDDLAQQDAITGPRPDEGALRDAQACLARATENLRRLEAAGSLTICPEDRAAIDAAHAEIDAAAHRADRKLGRAAALKRLERAQSVERELLDRFGFGTYLDVVLTGGRRTGHNSERQAAESAFLTARGAVDRLEQAMHASPELDHLHSERARLLAHVVDRLGVDPGTEVLPLLRAHPMLPGRVVEDLRQSLDAVGVRPVGVSLDVAAETWLRDQMDGDAAYEEQRAAIAFLQAEEATLSERVAALTGEIIEARRSEANAVEQLELATRSVGAVEAELTERAGGDANRFQRYIAAQQLRTQVEALTATLGHAEQEARLRLDRANHAAETADAALDRARGALDTVARKARSLAEVLPPGCRPTGDRLATLVELAEQLRERAAHDEPRIDEATAHLVAHNEQVDAAVAAAAAAGTGFDGPRDDDVRDGLARLLSEGSGLVVLDAPFVGVDASVLDELLGVVRSHAGSARVVLLSDDPHVLGWAIELAPGDGAVVSTDSVLNLCARSADTNAAGGSEDLRSTGATPIFDPAPPTHSNAGTS